MNEKNYNELLYEKMKREYDEFIADLKSKPPAEIIRHSYEKVMKEDILSCFELSERPQKEAKALYLLLYSIDDRIESAVKEMNQTQKESR